MHSRSTLARFAANSRVESEGSWKENYKKSILDLNERDSFRYCLSVCADQVWQRVIKGDSEDDRNWEIKLSLLDFRGGREIAGAR